MSRQLIKLKTRQNMIEDTPCSNFSSQPKYKQVSTGRDQKSKKRVRPPHYRGCVDASGSEAAAAAASISKEGATVDWSRVGYAGSGGRPRWLMIQRSMA